MAEDSVVPSKKKSKKNSVAKIEKLGVENGTDLDLPFTTAYRPQDNGTGKTMDEELHELLTPWGEEYGPTVRQLVTMRRMDGQARALYRLLTMPIRSALGTATFVPAEGGEEEAAFIEQVFTTGPDAGGMSVTFQRFMSQLLQGLFDGFAAFEKVFYIPETGPLKGKITLKKLAHRPAETVTFVVDKHGSFAGIRQRSYTVGNRLNDVFIPRDYCFYYAAQEEERKFYGVSFFQSAFYHYDKKVRMYYIAHLAAQRAAVGTRVGTVPANATREAKTEFASSLGNLALAQWLAMPEGFKVEILREGGSFSFLEYINHHNSQMSKSVLAGFFDENQGSGSGEGSLVNFAKPGDDMFLLMLRGVMDDIAAQINHYIIPQLIDLNFSGSKYPTFTWGNLTDEQRSAIAATFDKLATVAPTSRGVTPEFMRALEETQAAEFGLDIDYDEVDAREEEEAAAQSAANTMPPPADPNADPNAAPPADPNADGGTPMDPIGGSGGAIPAAGDQPVAPGLTDVPAPTGSAPAPAPTDAASAASPAPAQTDAASATQDFENAGPEWSLADLEKDLLKNGPSAGEEDVTEEDFLKNAVSLSFPVSDDLLALAEEMLALAREDAH